MSMPSSPNYGKHFQSHDEMKRMLLPSDDAVDAVLDWLQSAGITDIEEDADWINFRTTVGVANDLLDTQFQWFVSETSSHVRRLRALEYSIPESVTPHINMVQPTTRFGQIRRHHTTSREKPIGSGADIHASMAGANSQTTGTDCNKEITPKCLQDLYKFGGYKANANSGSKVGFCSYLEEYARYDDLALFEEKLAPYAAGQNFSVVTYNGGLNDQHSSSDSGEANLDLQYIVGVSAPLPVTEFSTGGRGELVPDLDQPNPDDNSNEPYLDFLQNVLKMDQKDLPQVISTSYGENEQVWFPVYVV